MTTMFNYLKNLILGSGGEVTECVVDQVTGVATKALTAVVEREEQRSSALKSTIVSLTEELTQSNATRDKAVTKLKAINA